MANRFGSLARIDYRWASREALMLVALGVLSTMLAGIVIRLLLVEAGNTERRPSLWLMRVAGLSVLILLLLFFAGFLFAGGPRLPT